MIPIFVLAVFLMYVLIMRNIFRCVFIAFCTLICSLSVFAEVDLPKVRIAGKDYYVYETKKGDSMYGISNRYGWNVDLLMEMNPTLAKKMKKGAKVYFPAEGDNEENDAVHEPFSAESYPMIRHMVKKGDSVYSISKLYDVPVEQIYLYNPESKYGLKRGALISIPQQTDAINEGASFLFYAIRPGDTLSGIADTYNTSVEQLLRDNKGISDDTFAAGDLLRVSVNSRKEAVVTQTVDETKLAHVETYKAGKDDTWESVADKTGVDVEDLKDFNQDTELKKNARIDVPVFVTTHVEKEVEASDPREDTAGGVRDIYNDVHMLAAGDSLSERMVRVAVLIEDPHSKRDNEFTRGAFLALDRMKHADFAVRLKVLQEVRSGSDSIQIVKALLDSLDAFRPDLVVTTHEKNFPLWLANYGEDKAVEIVNAFDVKSDLYLENPSIIHLLTPSSYFCEAVAEWENQAFPEHTLVMVGKKDSDDAFADAVVARSKGNVENISVDGLHEKKLDDWGHYLIYGYPTSRDEVASLLDAVVALKEANPLASVKVLGRPSWITFAEPMKENFSKADVFFPSRFFFDHNSEDGRKFIAAYSASFGHGPIRSFPTYAVAGFDIMNYFIEGLASNSGDFNEAVPDDEELQTPISLQRMGNWGGFFNPSAYIIHYTPTGDIEKILIGK